MSEEIKSDTEQTEETMNFNDVAKEIQRIMTNSTNTLRHIERCNEGPFADDQTKQGFKMIVMNIGNGLIAEEFAKFIKANQSDILIASNVPEIIKPT